MAAPEELSDILGVLVPGDGRMHFCRSDIEDLQIGDWVELDGQPARIVFSSDQVEYREAPADLPRVCRRLTPDEVANISAVARSEEPPSVSFGSLGRLHPRTPDLDAHIRHRLRLGETPILPRLGTIIQTAHGPGVLLSVSMRHQSATIRLESGEEVRVPVEELG